ncbi:MAG: cytochrome c [Terriglobales bacterium]
MRNFVAGIVATLVVLTLGGWLYLKLGYVDTRADSEPSRLETELAGTALRASAARNAPQQPNPIQPTESNLLAGARLYRDKCADCHGRPDNPVSDYGRSFNPRAPQFMQHPFRVPEDKTFFFVKHGVRWSAMPAWGNIMADSEIWQVVTFLKSADNLPPAVQQELHKPAGSNP